MPWAALRASLYSTRRAAAELGQRLEPPVVRAAGAEVGEAAAAAGVDARERRGGVGLDRPALALQRAQAAGRGLVERRALPGVADREDRGAHAHALEDRRGVQHGVGAPVVEREQQRVVRQIEHARPPGRDLLGRDRVVAGVVQHLHVVAEELDGQHAALGVGRLAAAAVHDGVDVEHDHGVAVVQVPAAEVAQVGAVQARVGRAAERPVDVQRDQAPLLAVVRVGDERHRREGNGDQSDDPGERAAHEVHRQLAFDHAATPSSLPAAAPMRSTSAQSGMPEGWGEPIVPMMRKPRPSSTRPERVPQAVLRAVAIAQ